MSGNWQAAEEGDLQDELDLDLDQFNKFENKDSILFVVDCSPEMFESNDHLKELSTERKGSQLEGEGEEQDQRNNQNPGISGFQAAMKCISATMQNKIISSENDRIGILCYSTAQGRNPPGFPNIFLLQDLDVSDAERIRQVESFAKDPEEFKKSIGSVKVEFPFGNVFWTAANLFSNKTFSDGTKRIFLFTCEDNPNASSGALQRAARTRGRDLVDLGILLELFAIPSAHRGDRFNFNFFYKNILNPLDQEDMQDESNLISKFNELLTRVRRKENRKRALARTELSLGPGMSVSIKLFSLFMEAKRGQYVWMNERTEEVMTPKTEWICKETGSILQPSDFKYSYDYGGEKIIFDKKELGELHGFGEEPGLKVIGFKSRAALKVSHNVTHSTFIYPDESCIKGSTAVIVSLLKGCLAKNKFILCRYTARKSSPPRLVALLPQAEQVDDIGTQLKAPGFNMIILPFADDLRHLKLPQLSEEKIVASHDQIDRAKAIISKLTLSGRFDPDAYDNPVLQKHYSNLQALALDQDVPIFNDSTLPDFKRMKARAGTLISEFKSSIPDFDNQTSDRIDETVSKKRAASSTEDPISSVLQVATQDDAAKLAKFTVNDLKAFLESVNIKPKRIKAEIIDQVLNYNK